MSDDNHPTDRIFQTDPDGRTRIEDRPSASGALNDGLQDMNFSTHILSLNAMALMHLGDVEGVPVDHRDREAAQHIIDTLKMLQAKTAGNLTEHEEQLLKTLLYDLHVKYVKANA